jgi:predicted  nucleic acid-binding Zn-ribbon protein
MPATADNLRDLHVLHQRAKALRDRIASGPKALAAREQVLAKRRAEVDKSHAEIKKAKADQKNKEVQVQAIKIKTDELRVKLNSIKKQAEYDAIRNQLAADNASVSRIENEVLDLMVKIEGQEAEAKAQEADLKKVVDEVAAMKADFETKAEGFKSQLRELESAIAEAEAIIPGDQRDQYRRVIKSRGADAMAAVEGNACTGCFVTVTAQMMNDLINANEVVFCLSCGRVLYLEEDAIPAGRR